MLKFFRGCLRLRFDWAALGWSGIANADLWQQVHALMLDRNDDVTVSKVKGHATPQDVAAGRVSERDKRGNDRADKLATNGAKSHAMPYEHEKRFAQKIRCQGRSKYDDFHSFSSHASQQQAC